MEARKLCKQLGIETGRMVGSGIYMSMQTYKILNKGDFSWDADIGILIWDGTTWLSESDIKRKIDNGK